MTDRLARLEARIEQLVEGAFSRLLAGRLQPREVAVRLARAMEDNAFPGPRDTRLAPSEYRVCLHPDDCAALLAASPDLASGLADELVVIARELDLVLTDRPVIHLEPDEAVQPKAITVDSSFPAARGATQPMPAVNMPPMPTPPKAYLIVDGERHVALDRPVATLGRKLDNTIPLDDPRVSRHHAQIRQRFGRWVVYDLGSASGTYVNNQRVEEWVLRPGDVIALSGVPLIYGEEESTGGENDDTGPTRPLPARPDAEPKLKDEGGRRKDER
nr:DUF3662 domain-containing protein [Chloroflexota bacterium]